MHTHPQVHAFIWLLQHHASAQPIFTVWLALEAFPCCWVFPKAQLARDFPLHTHIAITYQCMSGTLLVPIACSCAGNQSRNECKTGPDGCYSDVV